jgi:rRNA biogenesis protein RRP5
MTNADSSCERQDGLQTQPPKPRKDDAAAPASTSKKRKQPPTSSSSKNKKTAKAASAAAATSTANADTFRVEHLSYKRLLPGPTIVLVQVVQILPLELIVSLPDQLMANIPITNISKAFRKRLEEEADASSDDESEEEEEEDDDDASNKEESSSEKIGKLPNLSDMFYVGQYLRASVSRVLPPRATSTFASSSKQRGNELWKSSRRAELSLEPEVVNEGVSLNDLKNGQIVLQGYVKSVEDNGYIVDFGLQLPGASSSSNEQGSNTLTGFVSFKDEEKAKKHAVAAGDSWPKYRATLGGIVSARITKLAENARTCTVGIQQSDIENTLVSLAIWIAVSDRS